MRETGAKEKPTEGAEETSNCYVNGRNGVARLHHTVESREGNVSETWDDKLGVHCIRTSLQSSDTGSDQSGRECEPDDLLNLNTATRAK